MKAVRWWGWLMLMICAAARGQVLTYTVGVDVNCPTGLPE